MPFLTLSNRLTNSMSNLHLKLLLPIRDIKIKKRKFFNRQNRLYFKKKRKKLLSEKARKQNIFIDKLKAKIQERIITAKSTGVRKLRKPKKESKSGVNKTHGINIVSDSPVKLKISKLDLIQGLDKNNDKAKGKKNVKDQTQKPAYIKPVAATEFDYKPINRASKINTAPLYLYNNNYKIIEINYNNYKFKTTPLNIDFKKNTVNRLNFSIYLFNLLTKPLFDINDGLKNYWLFNKTRATKITKKYFRVHLMNRSVPAPASKNKNKLEKSIHYGKKSSLKSNALIGHANVTAGSAVGAGYLPRALNLNPVDRSNYIANKQAIINF